MQLFSFLFLITTLAQAGPRVLGIHKNVSSADAIQIKKGLVTLLEFPSPILEVRAGNQHVLRAALSQVSPNELTLWLESDSLGPTNLIVRAQRKVYVFDVIPSPVTHQDYVKVLSGFGSLTSTRSFEVTDSIEIGLQAKPQRKQSGPILEKEEL